jgi:hypothetical protein
VTLYRKWDFYLGVFGKPENDPIIEGLAFALNVIEESVRTDITMAVCRLGDSIKPCGRENLNFRTLAALYPRDVDLKRLVDAFVAACEPVRIHRDKLVAHSDKVARLTPQQAMIPQIMRKDIDAIMTSAGEIINHVGKRYGDRGFGFGIPGDGGADGLIYWLKKGWDNRMNFDTLD